jgi:hypothetical protein
VKSLTTKDTKVHEGKAKNRVSKIRVGWLGLRFGEWC